MAETPEDKQAPVVRNSNQATETIRCNIPKGYTLYLNR